MTTITLFFDGLCEDKNPGGTATAGWLIVDDTDPQNVLAQESKVVGQGKGTTNNYAEYCALGFGLRWIVDHPGVLPQGSMLQICGDSKLVICQLNDEWECKSKKMGALRDRCIYLLGRIREEQGITWQAKWIPRAENERADALSQEAYEQATGKKVIPRKKN